MSSDRTKKYSLANDSFNSFRRLLRLKKWNDAFELLQSHNEVATMIDLCQSTALHYACCCGAPLRIIDLLIQINPDLTKAKDLDGGLPLHRLCWEQADPAVVRRMLEANSSAAKVQDKFGRLPLHFAACNQDSPMESIEILLATYPEGVKVTNANGRLPLHEACDLQFIHPGLCQNLSLLIKANPDAASTADNDGCYPFQIMMLGIEEHQSSGSGFLRGLKMMLDVASDVARTPCPFFNGGLPLHYLLNNPPPDDYFSYLEGDLLDVLTALIDTLIEAHPGALIFADANGKVPLHIAVENCLYDNEDIDEARVSDNLPSAVELTDFHCQLIESLIKSNPSAASIPDNEGRLALHFACMQWPSNKTDRLTVLLAANPDALQHADNEGKTPLQYAFERESDAQEFVAGLISAIQKVEGKRYEYTNMAVEGLSVGLVGARKGLEEEREKVKSLDEEIAQLREEIAQLKS